MGEEQLPPGAYESVITQQLLHLLKQLPGEAQRQQGAVEDLSRLLTGVVGLKDFQGRSRFPRITAGSLPELAPGIHA